MAVAGFELAKRVDESGAHKVAEARAFLRSEPVIAEVGFGIRQVQFGVSDVEVAAEDDGFGLLELLELTQKGSVPTLPIRQARELPL